MSSKFKVILIEEDETKGTRIQYFKSVNLLHNPSKPDQIVVENSEPMSDILGLFEVQPERAWAKLIVMLTNRNDILIEENANLKEQRKTFAKTMKTLNQQIGDDL